MKLNILQIGTMDNKGGAALVSYRLKQKLEKLGHTTSMFVKQKYSDDENIFLIEKQNKLFKILSKLSRKITTKDIPNYIKNKTQSLLTNDIAFFNNKNLLNSKEFKNADIIHCHNLHGNYFNLKLLQKISKIKPVVWTLHDMWALTGHCSWAFTADWKEECNKWQPGCKNCPNLKTYPRLLWDNTKYLFNKKKGIYQNSKLNIVVPSLWLKQKIEKSILKNQTIDLIYNGTDNITFKKFNKIEVREKLNIPQDKKIIIFLASDGKNNIQKGWQYAKKIISHYKNNEDILFLCIGGRKDDEQLNSGNIKYIKYIKDESLLAEYYSISDIFLFTSLAENFPLTILEAMSCGTPIVSFNIGGVKEAATHKQNGYIAEYQNTRDLINGIEYIFSLSNDELNKMSKDSMQKIKEKFTLDIMANNYLKLYEKIIKFRL